MTMQKTGRNLGLGLGMALAALCAPCAWAQAPAQAPAAQPVDVAAKRAELRKMCDEALATIYKAKPAVKAEIAKAAGYGCFTSFGMSFFVGGAGGQGLVHSNATGKDTFMNMAQASGGLDFGIKQYREVLVFKDKATLRQFIDKGWEFGGSASATAAAGGKGGTADTTDVKSGPISIYPMTDTGLAAGVAAAGRKYWKDAELNAAK
jgi:lipid-binding SYLF domain-containing protein